MLAHSPRIITENLVLLLDAANPRNFDLTKVEVLVVAGGGGGGVCYGGGGGAGGLIYNSNFAVTPGTQLTVTVGNGGTNQVNTSGNGGNGGPSVFGALTAIGGGYGGGSCGNVGGNGGSGGGGSGTGGSSTSGGMGTSQQGTSGGTSPIDGGGGGGGAGSTGSIRQGGNGLGFTISGTFSYYGGGGSGGGFSSLSGGIGGGGLGGIALASGVADATVNTGGGGGGSIISGTGVSGLGGSGIVIVRYQGPQKAIGGTVTSVNGDTIHTFTTSGNFTPLVNTNGSAVLGLSDLSGNGNFGDTAGSPIYNSANGGSLVFEGSDEYVDVGNLGSGFSNFTVEIWFKSDSVTNYRNPIDCNFLIEFPGSYSNIGPRLEQNSSGTLGWVVGSGSNVYTGIDVVPSGLDGSKYHYAAITKSSSTLFTSYYNGSAVTTTNFSNWTGSMSNVNIGRGFSLSGERWFIGKIPSVKIYNRALTAQEISQNYNATKSRYI